MFHLYLNNELAGKLEIDKNQRMSFSYYEAYIDRYSVPVSYAMPLATGIPPTVFHDEVVFPFIENLMPEESMRLKIQKRNNVPEGDLGRLIELMAGDMAGAISILPIGVEPEGRNEAPLTKPKLNKILLDTNSSPFNLDNDNGRRVGLAGAQNKLPVTILNNLIYLTSDKSSTHILKPESEKIEFGQLVYNEFFCMNLCKRVGINTAGASLIEVLNKDGIESDCLSVERYDRNIQGGLVTKIHQEDFCQLNGHLSSKKYDTGIGIDFFDLIAFIKERCISPQLDTKQIVNLYIFNLVIGNRDAHAKNISFLYHNDGGIALAPAYDLVCTEVFDTLSREITMPVNGKATITEINSGDLRSVSEEIGMPYKDFTKNVDLLMESIKGQSQEILHEMEDMNLYEDSIKHIKQILAIIRDNSRILTSILK